MNYDINITIIHLRFKFCFLKVLDIDNLNNIPILSMLSSRKTIPKIQSK